MRMEFAVDRQPTTTTRHGREVVSTEKAERFEPNSAPRPGLEARTRINNQRESLLRVGYAQMHAA